MGRTRYTRLVDTGNGFSGTLPAGATRNGTAFETREWARVDTKLSSTTACTLNFQGSNDNGATWTTWESWPIPAATVDAEWPTPLGGAVGYTLYRRQLVGGAADSAVTAVLTLDPRAVSTETPVQIPAMVNIPVAPGNATFPVPLGGRTYLLQGRFDNDGSLNTWIKVFQQTAAGANIDVHEGASEHAAWTLRYIHLDAGVTQIHIHNTSAALTADVRPVFFPG